MADSKVKIVIEVDSKTGEAKFNQFGKTASRAGETGAKGFKKTSKSLDGVKSRLNAVSNLSVKTGAAMAVAAVSISAVTYAIKELAAAAHTEFKKYDTAITDMGKITDESAESIKSKIASIGVEYGNAAELTSAYYNVISAGVKKPVAAMDTLKESVKVAKAAHVESAQIVTGITALMEAYGDKIKGAGEAADLMFQIEASGKTTVQDLIPYIGELAGKSAALGVSQDELGASFAQVTLLSGNTSNAATQYKAVLTSLMAPSRAMTTLLSDYGGAQQAIADVGFEGVLKLISSAADGNAATLKKLMGSAEAVGGMLTLTGKNMEGYGQRLSDMAGKTGLAEKAFDDWSKSMEGVEEAYNNTIKSVLKSVGEELAPTIKSFMQFVIDNQEHLENTAVNITKIALATAQLAKVVYYASGIGVGVWLSEFWDGTRKVRKETEELVLQLERQKKLLESHPGYAPEPAKKGKTAAEIYADQWEKTYQKKLRAWLKNENEITKLEAKDAKNREKLLAGWLDVKSKFGKTAGEVELMQLASQYEAYKTVAEDKVALEQWWASEKALIEAAATSQSIALYKELYAATGYEEYAQSAINAYGKILDADQQTWSKILDNEEDALILRLRKEEEFARNLFGIFDDIVEADRAAANERVRIAGDMAEERTKTATRSSGSRNVPFGTDTSFQMTWDSYVGFLTPGVVAELNRNAERERMAPILAQQARELEDIKRAAERTAQLAQESAQREKQQIYEQSVRALQGAYGQYTGFMQQMERRTWGWDEYSAELARLMSEYQNVEYFEESLDLLGDMVSTLQTLESIEQSALSQYKSQTNILQEAFGTIDDMIRDMAYGAMAPVMGASQYGGRYSELLLAAQAGGDPETVAAAVQAFTSYVPTFLDFMADYGGNYADIYGSVLSDLELLKMNVGTDVLKRRITAGDLFEVVPAEINTSDLISNLDSLQIAIDTGNLPAAEEQIQTLVNALGTDVPGAAAGAVGTPNTLDGLMGLVDSLVNTQNPMTETSESLAVMTGNVQKQLATVGGFFDTLATSMGLTFGTEGAAGTAIGALTPPAVETLVPSGPQYSYLPHTETAVAVYEDVGYGSTAPISHYETPSGYRTNVGGEVTWYEKVPNWGAGGLTSGVSAAGELGPEWVVPTYEPQRSSFLRDVGVDSEKIGKAIAKNLAPMLMNTGKGGDIHVQVAIDGREIGAAVAAQIDQGDPELISQIQRVQ